MWLLIRSHYIVLYLHSNFLLLSIIIESIIFVYSGQLMNKIDTYC